MLTQQDTTSKLKPISIEVTGLYKQYGKVAAVKGIDFTVAQGEIFGLIGPDGGGKTTTFQILAGVMEATGGKIEVLGKPPREARLNIGYLTQKFSLYPDLSIEENLRYSARLRQVSETEFRQRKTKLLSLFSLQHFPTRLASQLSGGTKQKLALCCALIAQPQVLLLDEPTTGVDPVSRREFWDLLATVAAEGVSIVVATPYLDEAERCHRIALIYDGKIQQIGSLGQLRASLGLHRLELRAKDLKAVENVLGRDALKIGIADLQFFGDRLDVLVSDPQQATQDITQLLAQQQLPFDLQSDEPTLENVFVTRLRQQGSDPAFIEFPRYRGVKQDNTISTRALAIAARNLQKTFGEFQAVKKVDLEVKYGEIYGLLGANGAGKTTTIKMLCGLLPKSAGEMILAGQTDNLHSSQVRSRLGYMSQKFTLYDDLTIRQNLEFYCGVYSVPSKLRQEKINWVLTTCGLLGKENTVTGSLPGGWKQRVAFGASVMHEPEILFLDEPTSGVDPLARRQFWRLIRNFAQQGTAILVTTHYLEEAENCNRMGFMVAGEIVAQGSPSQIKAQQPGNLIEMIVSDNQSASNLLKQDLESWRISIFGDRLHLVLDNPQQDLPIISRKLTQHQIQIASQRAIPFSLEDAFIGIVQRTNARLNN
ncbi:ABC transporter ATP-binding component [Chondrocystis sp. NIES-4102]|nr:ABC transporter ATP-binding component [Chondrocystis sp. NIES-4102]